jgi:hypothetical protein
MTNRAERGPVAHAGHDALLIAQYAADDLDIRERAAAEQLVASCSDCAQVAADLRLIARATAELPEPARPREFTLTPEQAARLDGSGWRGIARRFSLGWIRSDVGRTLAAGLTTLGLAGLLIGTIPANISFGMGSAAAPSAAPAREAPQTVNGAHSGAPAPSAAASVQAYYPAAASPGSGPRESDGRVDISGESSGGGSADVSSSESPEKSTDQLFSNRDAAPGPSAPSAVLILSVASLTLGVGLFALRRVTSTTAC